MNSKITDEAIREARLQRAVELHGRSTSDDMTPQENTQLLEFLRESPKNVKEYLALEQMTQRLKGRLKEVPVDYSLPLEPSDAASSNVVEFDTARGRARPGKGRFRSWVQRGKIVSLTAAVFLVLVSLPWALGFFTGGSIRVPHGEQRTVPLPDGSVMQLNSQARVTVRYTSGERVIELEEGQALFKVAHEKARPFRVRAGRTEIVAVGTQFDVYRKPEGLTVTVVEGVVKVNEGNSVSQERQATSEGRLGANPAGTSISLKAGQQLRLDESRRAKPQPIDIGEATAWARHEIRLKDRPLGEVADEYGRYSDLPFVIEDQALRQMPVTVMFDAYKPRSFINFLRTFEGVEVDEGSDAIRVRLLPSSKSE